MNIRDAFRGMIGAEELSLLNDTVLAEQANQSVQELSASGAVDLSAYLTLLDVDGTKAYTMADGTRIGQRHAFRCIGAANTPDGVLTIATFADGSTLTFAAVGDEAEVLWTGSTWRLIRLYGATLA